MAVFDVTSELSLDSVSQWVALVRSTIPQKAASTTPGVLFGNKTDLVDRRVVSPKMGSAMAEKLGLMYFEGSAVSVKLYFINSNSNFKCTTTREYLETKIVFHKVANVTRKVKLFI
jgi:GTPase SAR1 family protein